MNLTVRVHGIGKLKPELFADDKRISYIKESEQLYLFNIFSESEDMHIELFQKSILNTSHWWTYLFHPLVYFRILCAFKLGFLIVCDGAKGYDSLFARLNFDFSSKT